jgi:hypothetical protein
MPQVFKPLIDGHATWKDIFAPHMVNLENLQEHE